MQTQVRSYNFVKSDKIIYYLIILTVALGLKFHYSRAGSDDLEWVLKPTAGLCQLITSVEFEYESGSGYISRERRIIIAPSCAGVNFMIAAFILASITGLMHHKKACLKILWLGGSLAGAYLATITVNALRIIIAIYTIDANFGLTWLNPERIHRFQGIVVYFFSLIVFYQIVHKINNMRFHNSWLPFLTYSAIVLGIPLIMHAWQNNFFRFMEHFFTVIGVSLLISVIYYFVQHKQMNRDHSKGNI